MPQTIVVRKHTATATTVPTTLANGELAANLIADPVKMWIGTPGGVKPLPSGVIVAPTEPANALANSLWWNSSEGRIYIRYQGAWVEIP